MSEATAVRVLLVTAANEEAGTFLARELVQERLAACANVIPGLVSVYWWEGEVEEDDEVLVLLKTTEDRLEELIERAKELHSYDVPELLALPVVAGDDEYVRWVEEETSETPEG